MYALRNLGYLKVSNFIKISDAPFGFIVVPSVVAPFKSKKPNINIKKVYKFFFIQDNDILNLIESQCLNQW